MKRYSSKSRLLQVKELIEGRNVLEIGFWDNNDLWEYHAKSAKTWVGIDYGEEAVALAKSKGYHALKMNLETDPLPALDFAFDCILIRHVLEHLDAAIAFLLNIQNMYQPRLIVIEVPNASWWALPLYTAFTPMHLDYHFPLHVREFLPRHFYEIAKRSALLRVAEIRYLHSFGTTPLGHCIDYMMGSLFPKMRRNLLCVMEPR